MKKQIPISLILISNSYQSVISSVIPAFFGIFLSMALEAAQDKSTLDPAFPTKADVLKKLEALGDNEAIVFKGLSVHEKEKLGDFAKGWHNMKKTGPGGRDYSNKMVWMSDRKRAFFCGANHGSPTRFNDAWEFDLPSLTWAMLYVPDYNDRGAITDYDKNTLVVEDGWLRTKKGGPGHPAHTWWGLTYDPTLKAAIWYNAWPNYRLKGKLDCIGAKKEDLYTGPPIWYFHTQTKKWEPMKTAKPWPRNTFGASLEFVPDLGKVVYQYNSNSWILDAEKKSWTSSPSTEGIPMEGLVCYDTNRRMFIGQRGSRKGSIPRTWHMPVKNGKLGKWEKVLETAEQPNGHDAISLMYYDPIGKVALCYERGKGKIWSYNPDKKAWTLLTPKGAPVPFATKNRTIGYMDLARNVFVVIGKNAQAWCYRYKKDSSPKKAAPGKN